MKKFLTSHIILLLTLVSTLLTACAADDSSHDEPLPDGMGRLRIAVAAADDSPTRGVNATPWQAADHAWEQLQTFRVIICKTDGTIVQIVSGTSSQTTVTSDILPVGSYAVYATANYADGYAVGSNIAAATTTVQLANGYSEAVIPMSGRLAAPVSVTSGTTTNAGTITVYRLKAKLSFEFTNSTTMPTRITGIEIDPVNQASAAGKGIYLFSQDDLESTANLTAGTGVTMPDKTDVGPVVYQPATPLTLAASATGSLFFYVNETDASATATQNEYSVRFRLKRAKVASPTTDADWFDDEFRLGLTTSHNGTDGGFNVIRRNDWIHIPVTLRGWQFRVEMLPFTPIAGFAAYVGSMDALSTAFNTQGYICMHALFRADSDTEGAWSDFNDGRITFAMGSFGTVNLATARHAEAIDATTQTGLILDGDLSIFTDLPQRLGTTENIVANLSAQTGTVTITVRVKLGDYFYQFSHNVRRV